MSAGDPPVFDALPSSAKVYALWEATDETSPGSGEPVLLPTVAANPDPSHPSFNGRSFLRFTVLFDGTQAAYLWTRDSPTWRWSP